MIETRFTATAYSTTLTGTTDAFGWTPDAQTAETLAAMEPTKRRRAEHRCKRAAAKAFEQAVAR